MIERDEQLARLLMCREELNLDGKRPLRVNPNPQTGIGRPANTLEATLEFFWANVEKTEKCWLWMGRRFPSGYGRLWINWRNVRAHRFSYMAHFGLIQDRELCVCHECDNPPCVRPDHFFLGTTQENTGDCNVKGRRRYQRGEAHWHATVTVEIVQLLRRLYDKSKGNGPTLARQLGVNYECARAIINRDTWRHIT